MKTQQEIKVGLKFKLTKTGRTYEVTRISHVSVWFKDITRTPIWREAKTTFLNKFNNGFELI
jgi:hypothetical protein